MPVVEGPRCREVVEWAFVAARVGLPFHANW